MAYTVTRAYLVFMPNLWATCPTACSHIERSNPQATRVLSILPPSLQESPPSRGGGKEQHPPHLSYLSLPKSAAFLKVYEVLDTFQSQVEERYEGETQRATRFEIV